MKLITLNAICLKLPHHIKTLETDISYVADAKVILEKAKYLSNITFRSYPDHEEFFSEILRMIINMDARFVHNWRMDDDWVGYGAAPQASLWIGKYMEKQL